jgi:hypothetical protein
MRKPDETPPTRGFHRLLLGIAIPALALGAGTALAASNLVVDCDDRDVADRLDDLTITIVDLKPSDDENLDRDRLRLDDSTGNAPVLRLGTRVATIIRGVFGDEGTADSANGKETVRPPLEASVTPLAGSRSPLESTDDESADDDVQPYSPIEVHREMYRTDI